MPPIKRKSTLRSEGEGSPTVPGLRRAPTFTIDSDTSSSTSSVKRSGSLVRRTSSKTSLKSTSSVTSLSKKASFVREGSGICSSILALESGSSIGKTGSLKATAVGSGFEVLKVAPLTVDESGSKTAAAVVTLRKSLSEVNDLIKSTSLSKTPSLMKVPSIRKTPSLTKTPSVRSDGVATAPPLPPGGLLEIVFSFDTTGSMYSYLAEVRGRIKDMVQRLQADIPGIRIAIIAHGDYCDKDNYIVKWIDFGASVPELCDFVENVKVTSGGDTDECYELVLRRAQEVLSWTPGSQRSLVIIGDAPPHEPGYTYCDFTNDIDWRDEAKKLKAMGVRIYSVGAGSALGIPFYKSISETTGGRFMPLNNFNVIFDMLMSICYREGGEDLFEAYESEVRGRGQTIDKALDGMFKSWKGDSGDMVGPSLLLTKKSTKRLDLTKGAAKAGIKGVKKTRRPERKSPKLTRTSKAKADRQKRESLVDTKFAKGPLKRLNWSRWMLGVSPCHVYPVRKEIGPTSNWSKTSWSSGFCNNAIFTKDDVTDTPAVYEFAVRPPGKRKKYPVCWRMTTGVPRGQKWYSYLLSQKRIRSAVKTMISKNGDILVRRGTFKRKNINFMQRLSKLLSSKYDYAWMPQKKNAKCRKLRRCRFDISSDSF